MIQTLKKFFKSPSTRRPQSIKKNTMWMMIGNSYYALCQWLVLVAIARLGGASDVGIFMLALSLTGPIVLFFELGIRAILATDVKHQNDYSSYFVARMLASSVGMIVCIFIAVFYGESMFWTILVVGLSKTIESFSQMYYGYAVQQQNLNRVATSLIFRGTFSTAILVISYALTQDITISAVAYTLTWLTTLVLYDSHNVTEKIHSISKETLKRAWKISLSGIPLGTTALLGVLGLFIPRYFLEHTHGVAELGVFSSMAYFITVGNVFVYALGQAMMPALARYNADGEKDKFARTVMITFGIVFLMGVCGILAAYWIGEPVMDIMYGPEFAARADILPLVAIAAAITYLANIFGYAINAKRIFMAQAPAQFLVMIGSILGSWYYVPSYGLDGAAYVLVISSVIMFFTFAGILYHYRNR